MTCNNKNHTFTNGKHDPICNVIELADHITTVRIIATSFSDHIRGRYNTFVNGAFGFFLTGYDNGSFVSECLSMLDELEELIKIRVNKYCCYYDEDQYEFLMRLIRMYRNALNNIDRYHESDIKLILEDLVDKLLKFYDISLIESEEDDSDYLESETDSGSITLSDEDNDSVYYGSDYEESNSKDQSFIR